jgi:hypothetical protein
LVEEVPVPHPDRPAAEMQRTSEFNMIVNEISAKVEARYFTQQAAETTHQQDAGDTDTPPQAID